MVSASVSGAQWQLWNLGVVTRLTPTVTVKNILRIQRSQLLLLNLNREIPSVKIVYTENWIFNLGDFLGVMKKRWDLWFLERNKNYCFTWSLYTYLNLLTRKNLRSISRNFMACKKHNFRSILGLSFFILRCWPKVVGQYLQVW